MPDLANRYPENVPGKFYVDDQCIDCDLCRESAPDFFTRDEDGGYSYVNNQPSDQEGIDQCTEALEGCPVEAIGNDGESIGAEGASLPQSLCDEKSHPKTTEPMK